MDTRSKIAELEKQIKEREDKLQELQGKQRTLGSAILHPFQFNKNKKEIETLTAEIEKSKAQLVDLKAQLLRETAAQSAQKNPKKRIIMFAGIAGGVLLLLIVGLSQKNKDVVDGSGTDYIAASEKTTVDEEAIKAAESRSSLEAAMEASRSSSEEESRKASEEESLEAAAAESRRIEEQSKYESAAQSSREAASYEARKKAEYASVRSSSEKAERDARQASREAAEKASREAAEQASREAAEQASREAAAQATAATAPPRRNITFTSELRFKRNQEATLTINAQPGVEYSIAVYYNSGKSTAKGLVPTIADANGNVSWTWHIGGSTAPGTYRVIISGNGERIEKYFTVVTD